MEALEVVSYIVNYFCYQCLTQFIINRNRHRNASHRLRKINTDKKTNGKLNDGKNGLPPKTTQTIYPIKLLSIESIPKIPVTPTFILNFLQSCRVLGNCFRRFRCRCSRRTNFVQNMCCCARILLPILFPILQDILGEYHGRYLKEYVLLSLEHI